MTKSKTNKTAIAYTLLIVLALALFLTGLLLKLCGIISLSWWWITASVWGLLLGTLLGLGTLSLCVIILSSTAKHRH